MPDRKDRTGGMAAEELAGLGGLATLGVAGGLLTRRRWGAMCRQ